MDDAFLVRVLDRMANGGEKRETLWNVDVLLGAVLRDWNASNQFHGEVGPSFGGYAGVKDGGDVGVVHHRERLSFSFKPAQDLFGVHSWLDQFDGDSSAEWCFLFRHPNDTEPTLSDLLQEFVGANDVAGLSKRFQGTDSNSVEIDLLSGWRIEESLGLPVRYEKGLDFSIHLHVITAGLSYRLVSFGPWAKGFGFLKNFDNSIHGSRRPKLGQSSLLLWRRETVRMRKNV